MRKYEKNTDEPWRFTDEESAEHCCKQDDSSDASQDKDCLDSWKRKLSEARKAMEGASAKYDKANKVYRNSATWEAKLEKWIEDAEEAHDKAVDVKDELALFLGAVERTNTSSTQKTVESVLCLVRNIFEDMTDLLRESAEKDSMGEIQELKNYIECESSYDANTKETALGCISPYEEQMKKVAEVQKDLLYKLLDILQCANLLVTSVEKPGNQSNVGLTWQINDLRKRISGETTYVSRDRTCQEDEVPKTPNPPCEGERVDPSEPLFPILTKDYYIGLKVLYDKALGDSKSAKEQKAIKRSTYDEAKSCYNGLKEAIKAAEAAKTAK